MKITVHFDPYHGQRARRVRVRDDGYAYILREADTPELQAAVREAASRCPVDAMVLSD